MNNLSMHAENVRNRFNLGVAEHLMLLRPKPARKYIVAARAYIPAQGSLLNVVVPVAPAHNHQKQC